MPLQSPIPFAGWMMRGAGGHVDACTMCTRCTSSSKSMFLSVNTVKYTIMRCRILDVPVGTLLDCLG